MRSREEFDLGPAVNNFYPIADAVKRKYPHVAFGIQGFENAAEKLIFLEASIDQRRPILISLGMAAEGGWHLMPVLGYNDTDVYLLYMVGADGKKDIRAIKKWELMRRHYEWDGRHLAFLDSGSR